MVQTTAEATVDIAVPPSRVFDLLTDLDRIGEMSPECHRAEWEGAVAGPRVGAILRGHNRSGKMEWTARAIVTHAEPGKLWCFAVPADDGRSTLWRYVIEETAGGSRVTQSFFAPVLDNEFFQKIGRYELLVANLEESLQRLKRMAEAESPTPGD